MIKRVDKNLIFELERQKALEKELNCKFIRINTNNDLDYEISDIQKFIADFDNNKTKDEIKNDKIKELKSENNDLRYKCF